MKHLRWVIEEGSALGAAIHACWVWQKESGVNTTINEVCDGFITCNHNLVKTPRQKYKNTYDKLKILYKSLSSRIQGLEGDNPFKLYSALKI